LIFVWSGHFLLATGNATPPCSDRTVRPQGEADAPPGSSQEGAIDHARQAIVLD
jgi:hypothetical protein